MATTFTVTSTMVRLEVIKTQIKVALRRTTVINAGNLAFIEKLLDNKCAQSFSIYGMDYQNLCRAQLSLEIDWNEYDFQLSQGRARISIDERWTDNTAIEVDEAIKLFMKFVDAKSLKTEWGYSLCAWADNVAKRVELGITPSGYKSVQWSPDGEWVTEIPELPELRVGFKIKKG